MIKRCKDAVDAYLRELGVTKSRYPETYNHITLNASFILNAANVPNGEPDEKTKDFLKQYYVNVRNKVKKYCLSSEVMAQLAATYDPRPTTWADTDMQFTGTDNRKHTLKRSELTEVFVDACVMKALECAFEHLNIEIPPEEAKKHR